ncbi:MAG TPA: TonB family protein [Candidatus Omnitrophota bacterium]|nr:TonB family protein [Candidatus Omnitrophota bacterium]HPT07091.1 TonB family protein [Candidatus Omnitrophota bacterium]
MRKVGLVLLIGIIGFAMMPLCTHAANDYAEVLKLYMGETRIIPVSNPTRIAIGNPAVADVGGVSKTEITLSPKAPGSTTLTYWDNFGEQTLTLHVASENMTEIKRRIDNMLAKLEIPGISTQAEDEEGKVILTGVVKTQQDRERIAIALGKLSEKTLDLIKVKEEESVIEIEVQVLELTKDASKTLGFTWPGSVTLSDLSAATTTAQTGLKNVFYVSQFTRSAFDVTLDALIVEGKARVLSRPRLACQSGKEAELMVGGEKPVFTTSVQATAGSSTSVEYKEYGIKMKIKPTLNEDHRIKIGLNVEVSEVGTAETIGSATTTTAKAYPLSKRNIVTELFMNDAQTLAIGGLTKQKKSEDIRKTPILGDLPLVGLAFRKKTYTEGGGTGERGDMELFVTITPTVIADKKTALPEASTPNVPQKPVKLIPQDALTPDTALPEPLRGYATIVKQRILDNLTYPDVAKTGGFQGTTILSLHLTYLGELKDAVVKTSSGYQVLDASALAVAKALGTYPPFPPSIDKKDLWIDVPIAYRLE